MNDSPDIALRGLPAVQTVLDHEDVRPLIEAQGRGVVLTWVREALDETRQQVRAAERLADRGELLESVAEAVAGRAAAADRLRLGPVINATGVILHTGLGRAPLSAAARQALIEAAGATNVEIDLDSNERRYRGYQLQPLWQTLTGCEDALIVNNNAAATLLTLQALCAGRDVVISRGQLIEIGGSFRLPEIFELSGARLHEVGTTNRTRLSDYERAIGPDTAAVMHVHSSNYRIVGFATAPGIAELARLAHARGLVVIDDIGSGSLVDVSQFGLVGQAASLPTEAGSFGHEPTFPESIAAGADVSLGSGDKLLGGPQAGIILGRRELVAQISRHPLARAVRVDKLTLAALQATLEAYLRGSEAQDVPVVAMLAAPVERLQQRAEAIRNEIGSTRQLTINVVRDTAPVGGGSLPAAELETAALELQHAALSVEDLARRLRVGTIRLVGRIRQDALLLDLRSVAPEDDARVALAVRLADGQ